MHLWHRSDGPQGPQKSIWVSMGYYYLYYHKIPKSGHFVYELTTQNNFVFGAPFRLIRKLFPSDCSGDYTRLINNVSDMLNTCLYAQ